MVSHDSGIPGFSPGQLSVKTAPMIPDLPAPDLAKALLGATLTIRGSGGIIIETEAYQRDDPASHSFPGPTARNAAMFGPPGHAYIYRIYGIHLCLNVVGRVGEAVLIRALTPTHGIADMAARRPRQPDFNLCSGPGKLAQALGLTMADNHMRLDLTLDPQTDILTGPRIGITKAIDQPWRFGLNRPGLSRAFPRS